MITATSVGLQPAGYGNARFCWLDSSDPLIGAMIVPIVILLIISVITIVMSIKLVLTTKRAIIKQDVRRDMRNRRFPFYFIKTSKTLKNLKKIFFLNEHKIQYKNPQLKINGRQDSITAVLAVNLVGRREQ